MAVLEPIEFESRAEINKAVGYQYPLFAITLRPTSWWYHQVGLFHSRTSIEFLVWKLPAGGIVYSGPSHHRMTSEEFIDFLMDNYPDYVEWFLFHPEWL